MCCVVNRKKAQNFAIGQMENRHFHINKANPKQTPKTLKHRTKAYLRQNSASPRGLAQTY
jgi:hypothetical protein